jgi:hypothetical protein
MLVTKKVTWHRTPAVSKMLRILGSQKLPMKRSNVNAHIITVECHLFPPYSGSLKLLSPTMIFGNESRV